MAMHDDGRWRNDTGKWQYQLISSLRHPCRRCIALHGQIAPDPWPQQHPHCECESIPIMPGGLSPLPVSDPPEVLGRLDQGALGQLLGAELEALVNADLVTLDDVVGDEWDFAEAAELVRRRGLTRERMIAAGVPGSIADRLAGPPG